MTTPIKFNLAVTGLNATDNPAPGVAVIRSIKENQQFKGKVIGLAYDSLEPGIYMENIVDYGWCPRITQINNYFAGV